MSEDTLIRIMVVDDNAVIRSGLRAFLLAYEDMEVVAEAENGEQAVQVCEKAHPDVVLLDLIMPGYDGYLTTQILRKKNPEVQVIALVSFNEPERLLHQVMEAGAIGYLPKDISSRELARSIRAAYTGNPIRVYKA